MNKTKYFCFNLAWIPPTRSPQQQWKLIESNKNDVLRMYIISSHSLLVDPNLFLDYYWPVHMLPSGV